MLKISSKVVTYNIIYDIFFESKIIIGIIFVIV